MALAFVAFATIMARVVIDPSGTWKSMGLDKDNDGQLSKSEDPWMELAQVAFAVFGVLHTAVSVAMCVVFIHFLIQLAVKSKYFESATEKPDAVRIEQDGVPKETMAVVIRVTISTLIAVVSTLICYFSIAFGLANWFTTLAIDSIVNDAALLWVAYMGAVDDSSYAQDAQWAQWARWANAPSEIQSNKKASAESGVAMVAVVGNKGGKKAAAAFDDVATVSHTSGAVDQVELYPPMDQV